MAGVPDADHSGPGGEEILPMDSGTGARIFDRCVVRGIGRVVPRARGDWGGGMAIYSPATTVLEVGRGVPSDHWSLDHLNAVLAFSAANSSTAERRFFGGNLGD